MGELAPGLCVKPGVMNGCHERVQKTLLRAFSCHCSVSCSVSGSLPSLCFPLAAGESGDLGVLEV